jgi:hypothetical protein
MAGADSSSWWRKAADTSTPASSSNAGSSWNPQSGPRAAQQDSSDWRSSSNTIKSRQQPQQNSSSSSSALSRAAAGALTVQLRSASSPERLQQLLEINEGHLTAPHVSAAFNALANNFKHSDPRALETVLRQQLLPALETLIEDAEAAADPTTTAVASEEPDTTTSSRRQPQQQRQHQLDSQSCAVILQSLSRLQDRSRLSAASSVAQSLFMLFLQPKLLQQAIPQGIAMVTTAAAKVQVRARNFELEKLLTALLDLAAAAAVVQNSSKAVQISPMHVSQTLWGVATMLAGQKRTPPTDALLQLFTEVAALLTHPQLQLLQEAKPVEVCNTLSAFVIAGLPASSLPGSGFAAELLGHLAALQNLRTAIARDISRTLWAAAKLGAAVDTADCKALVAMFCSGEMLLSANAQVRVHRGLAPPTWR